MPRRPCYPRRRHLWPLLTASIAVAICCPLHAASRKATAPAKKEQACVMTPFATARVAAIVDGRTLLTADGREIRLAGIDLPPPLPEPSSATDSLTDLTEGNDISLRHLKPAADRYGRLIADAVVIRDGSEISLARELVAQGLAQVSAGAATFACAAELLAAERAARAAQLGLWADPRYSLRQADRPDGISAARGRNAVVDGVVVSVRESGGTIYVNFGRRWSEDFTVTILKRIERRFTAAGLEPKTLQGRRVRGVIEERGGPWIEATTPAQIEIVTTD